MWVADLPVAALPLWQLAQLVAAVKPLWLTFAPLQPLILWQLSQALSVVKCLADLVWHVAHWLFTETLAWNFAGVQAPYPLLWQVSQLPILTPLSLSYGVWVADLPSAGGKAPLWQVEHWLLTDT
jgi:hypothetical protein